MTGRRRPPRGPGQRPPPKTPQKPKGFDDVPQLSDEEVERRVDVRGGGAPRGPVERAPRAARAPRRQERTVARDSMLLLGLLVVGLVAVRILLPDGPLSASASPSPGATNVAAASLPVVPATHTPGSSTLVTLVPPTLGPPTEVPASVAPATAGPTAAPTPRPVPTPTLRPGETPRPTPKPTKTPTPTTAPTPGPTLPNTATVIVKMHVINNSGGSGEASDWTMTISGEVGGAVSPNNFPGSEAGTTVTIASGKGYLVTDNAGAAGYGPRSATSGCNRLEGSGGLAPGTTVTCTITRNDRPRVEVITHVINDDSGGSSAGDWSVTVTGGATPSSFDGTEAGRVVVVTAGAAYSVDMTGPGGYSQSTSGACSTTLGIDDAQETCTFTFNDDPPAPSGVIPLVPFLLAPARRWRSIPTT